MREREGKPGRELIAETLRERESAKLQLQAACHCSRDRKKQSSQFFWIFDRAPPHVGIGTKTSEYLPSKDLISKSSALSTGRQKSCDVHAHHQSACRHCCYNLSPELHTD